MEGRAVCLSLLPCPLAAGALTRLSCSRGARVMLIEQLLAWATSEPTSGPHGWQSRLWQRHRLGHSSASCPDPHGRSSVEPGCFPPPLGQQGNAPFSWQLPALLLPGSAQHKPSAPGLAGGGAVVGTPGAGGAGTGTALGVPGQPRHGEGTRSTRDSWGTLEEGWLTAPPQRMGPGRSSTASLISWNHRMVWAWRDLEAHLFQPLFFNPLPWAETPSIIPRCSEPRLTWPWSLAGMGHHSEPLPKGTVPVVTTAEYFPCPSAVSPATPQGFYF